MLPPPISLPSSALGCYPTIQASSQQALGSRIRTKGKEGVDLKLVAVGGDNEKRPVGEWARKPEVYRYRCFAGSCVEASLRPESGDEIMVSLSSRPS